MNFFKKNIFKGKKQCFVEFLHTLFWPHHAASLGLPSGTSRLKGSFQEALERAKKSPKKVDLQQKFTFFGEEKVKISKSF